MFWKIKWSTIREGLDRIIVDDYEKHISLWGRALLPDSLSDPESDNAVCPPIQELADREEIPQMMHSCYTARNGEHRLGECFPVCGILLVLLWMILLNHPISPHRPSNCPGAAPDTSIPKDGLTFKMIRNRIATDWVWVTHWLKKAANLTELQGRISSRIVYKSMILV